MKDDQPSHVAADNVEVVRRALTDLDALPDLLSEDLVWHFYGGVEGIATDDHGLDNIYANLWGKLFEVTGGTLPLSRSASRLRAMNL